MYLCNNLFPIMTNYFKIPKPKCNKLVTGENRITGRTQEN